MQTALKVLPQSSSVYFQCVTQSARIDSDYMSALRLQKFDSWLNAKQSAEVIFANPFLLTTSSLVVLADVTTHGELEPESEGD